MPAGGVEQVGESPVLAVRGLRVCAGPPGAEVTIVEDVSLELKPGTTAALVGESGCGKTTTALAIMGLLPATMRVRGGEVILGEQNLLSAGGDRWARVRGRRVGMVFQDPGGVLNPVRRVGEQIVETIRAHRRKSRREAWREAQAMLRELGLPEPGRVMRAYPHRLSGGMAQRVALALAVAGGPEVLIADEPAGSLDVLTQEQVLGLVAGLQARRGLAVLLIAHDLRFVRRMAEQVYVMYAGQIVERGPAARVLSEPAHPYTRALVAAEARVAGVPPQVEALGGEVPRPGAWPPGCRFHPRCPIGRDEPQCRSEQPAWVQVVRGHEVRCFKPLGGGESAEGP